MSTTDPADLAAKIVEAARGNGELPFPQDWDEVTGLVLSGVMAGRSDQAQKDFTIALDRAERFGTDTNSRYADGSPMGLDRFPAMFGAMQAAETIGAQFAPAPARAAGTASVICTVGGCGTAQELPDDGAGRIPLAPIEGWFFSTDSGWLCPTHAPNLGRRAPVQASFPRRAGSITWAEHEEAWAGYALRFRGSAQDQDAERIAQRGGFGYSELVTFLGHEPTTFEENHG